MRRTTGGERKRGAAARLAVVVPVTGVVAAVPLAGAALPGGLRLPAAAMATGAACALLAVASGRLGTDRRAGLWRALAVTAAAGVAASVIRPVDAATGPGWPGALLGAVALVGLLGVVGALVGPGGPGDPRWRSRAGDTVAAGTVGALVGTLAAGAAVGVDAAAQAGLAGAAVGVALPVLSGLRHRPAPRPALALVLAALAGRAVAHASEAAVAVGTLAPTAGLRAALAAAGALPLLVLAVLPRRAVGHGVERPRPRTRATLGRVGPPIGILLAVVAVLAAHADRPDGAPRPLVALLAGAAAVVAASRLHRAVAAGDRARRDLTATAGLDPLTGLPGREQVEDRLLAALDGRADRPAAVLLLDVDRFQHVNDTRGHRHGDAVLRELADRLVRAAPTDAVVGRTAGDEYTVAAVGLRSEEEVLHLAHRLLGIFDRPLRVAGEDVFLTGTVGIATDLGRPDASVHDLFREADTALHRAKAEARGGATVFDAGMRLAVEHRVDTEIQLRGAIDRGELSMHYQPVVDIATGVVNGFEALMRWTQPTGRIVGPGSFIGVAEETGLVVPMGSWAITESLYQLRRWIDEGVCARNVGMAVNLAARQLHDAGLVATVMGALHGAALPPHQLTLEVTETALLSDTGDVERTIDRLKALGVQIALDDFGTGYSSLAHLRRFPIDRIKVDRSFVGNLETSAEDRALVRSIVVMARELGKDVVAEGVESRGQLEVLARMGCAKAQGFLFSEPLPAHAVGRRAITLEPPRRPDAAAG